MTITPEERNMLLDVAAGVELLAESTEQNLVKAGAELNALAGNLADTATLVASIGTGYSKALRDEAARIRKLVPARRVALGAATTRQGGVPALRTFCGGPLGVLRIFDGGFVSYASSKLLALAASGPEDWIYSIKPGGQTNQGLSEVERGAYDPALRQIVSAFPTDRRIWFVMDHESDNKAKGITPAIFRDAFDRFASIVNGVGKPNVEPCAVFMGYSLEHEDMSPWMPSDRTVTIGVDPYNFAMTGEPSVNAPDRDPAEIFDPILATIAGLGFDPEKVIIAETGIDQSMPAARRLEWIKQLIAWCAEHRPPACAYFDSAQSNQTVPRNWFLDRPMAIELGQRAREFAAAQ